MIRLLTYCMKWFMRLSMLMDLIKLLVGMLKRLFVKPLQKSSSETLKVSAENTSKGIVCPDCYGEVFYDNLYKLFFCKKCKTVFEIILSEVGKHDGELN